MAKRSGAGPRPKAGKLIGGSKGGTGTRIRGVHGAVGSGTTDPSQSGNPDVVQQRNAAAAQGIMQRKQLAGNKSIGINPGRVGGGTSKKHSSG